MEIDIGLALAVVLSSGAGWYAGHYFERKKAQAAFARVRSNFAMASMQSTSGMLSSAMTMFEKLKPDMTKEQRDALVNEYIATCNSQGLNLQIMNEATAAKFGITEEFMRANSNRTPE